MDPVRRRGRKKKNVNFNPNKEFLNEAKKEFLKNGGKITKIENDFDDYFHHIYRSGLAMNISDLEEIRL